MKDKEKVFHSMGIYKLFYLLSAILIKFIYCTFNYIKLFSWNKYRNYYGSFIRNFFEISSRL